VSRLRRLGGSPVAWSATAVFLTLLVVWSMITPGFRNPDEPQHVNSVLRVAEGGGWPPPFTAHLTEHVLRAKTLTGFSATDGQRGNWGGGTLLPGVRPQYKPSQWKFFAFFSTQRVTPPAKRLPFDELRVTRPLDVNGYGDQMTQHPPLYYAVSAGVVLGLGALDWPFDRTLELMRLVSVAMVALLPLMAFSVTRRLTGSRQLADLAAVLPIAVPQLTSIGGSVSNDALVILLGGLSAVLLARVLSGDRTWRTLLLLAVTLGLALLTKGTLLALVPVAGLAVVVGLRRSAAGPPMGWLPTLGRLAAVWGIAFVVGGWWWALNLIRYGMLQPHPVRGPAEAAGHLSVVGYFGHWWGKLATSFWGRFGWLELPLNQAVVLVLTGALTVAVLLGLRRRDVRVPLLVLLTGFVLTAILLFQTTYTSHEIDGGFAGIQGRYLFGTTVPVFAAAAIGLGSLAPEGGRLRRWLPSIVLPFALATAAYGLAVGFLGFYLDEGWSVGGAWSRMVGWSPFPGWAAAGLLVTLVVLSVVAFVVSVRAAVGSRASAHGEPDETPELQGSTVPAT
jgi:4-amino-4-deoxy-L-arabinose transferase-like glycosyltransferase